MKTFSVRPVLTLKGRTLKGLRGWSGKPLHPPLTDFPIVGYVLAAGFDVVSRVVGPGHALAHELWHAATFTMIFGAAVSMLTALTGVVDGLKSSQAGTQVRRTINTHAAIMVTVTALVAGNLVWRLNDYHTSAISPLGITVLSVVIASLVIVGATFGGSLVFEHGFNVETAGDSPVWHRSERDVLPCTRTRRVSPMRGRQPSDQPAVLNLHTSGPRGRKR
jgi:uncharacterized membrane protein